MKFGLEQHIIDIFIEVFEANSKVDKAFVFGSRAKGNYRPDSDIDIAIKGQDLSIDDIIAMSVAFEAKGITHKFDLIDYNSIKEPALKDHIDRVGIEFYSRWKDCKLGNIAEITSSKRIFFSDYVTNGIPFYRSKEIIEKALGDEISTDLFIANEKFDEIRKKFGAPINGDILISAVGERAGIPYCVKNDGDFYFKDGNLIWFRNFHSAISSSFLVYYLNSSIGQQRLESTMIGSAQKALTIIGLKNLHVAFPPFAEQIAIASILSSLDDKIDLLHRQNNTLEQLAETLFRQWFVEEAEESWEVGKLDDEFEFTMGQSPLGAELNEDGIGTIFYQGRSDFGFRFPTPRVYTTASIRLAKKLDTLISVRAPVGDMNMAFEDCCLGRGVAAFRYKLNNVFYSYTYYKLRSLMKSIKQFEDNGSVFGSIGKDDFRKLKNIIPPYNKIEGFQKEVKPIDDKILLNETHIRTLTQTRDSLLSKLISGEVRVTLKDR
jgi:type I restriction enzyme, S subunit